ncbi:MAG: mannose-6-phosphate isomerase, class I [Planctomycetota bacterium]|nr:MAG: mannose-6-phosphate isomerase, class I [Planctomycetota bacterium]
MTTPHIRRLENAIQPYAWGSRYALAQLQGREAPSEGPEAELWIGAHPKAPSQIVGEGQTLLELINAAPDRMLGPESRTRFGDTLPFLLKILAAQEPLSLQAHPSRAQARAGFHHEERARVPLSDPERSYKDDRHKPELICALGAFHALCGFRPIDETQELLGAWGLSALPAYERLKAKPRSRGLQSCCEALWQLEPSALGKATAKLVKAAQRCASDPKSPQQGFASDLLIVAQRYPGDVGLLFMPLLHHVVLAPGEALFLPAGCLHSYLHGVGVEIMANSDNVLRGGLTPKHIDVHQLLRTIRFEPTKLRKLVPDSMASQHDFEPDVEEFALSMAHCTGHEKHRHRPIGPEFLLVTEGDFSIEGQHEDPIRLRCGQSVFVPGLHGEYSFLGTGTIFIARLGTGQVAVSAREN